MESSSLPLIDKSGEGVKGAVLPRWLPTVLYMTAFRCSFPAPNLVSTRVTPGAVDAVGHTKTPRSVFKVCT